MGDHYSGMRGSSYQPFASNKNAPKGQKQSAQGIALGRGVGRRYALKGQPMEQREQCEHAQTLPSRDRGRQSQKHCCYGDSFAPVGRWLRLLYTQGDALG